MCLKPTLEVQEPAGNASFHKGKLDLRGCGGPEVGGEFGFYCVHHVPALSEPSPREPVEFVVFFLLQRDLCWWQFDCLMLC